MKSTFKTLFYIQVNKTNKEGKAPIICRITINTDSTTFSTKLNVDPERWSPKNNRTKGRTTEDKQINAHLDSLENSVRNHYYELMRGNADITADIIKHNLFFRRQNENMLMELCEHYIADYSKLVPDHVSYKQLSRYVNVKHRLKEFIKHRFNCENYPLSAISKGFIKDFENYLKGEESLHQNTASKVVQRFRTIFNTALDNGWVQADPFANIKLQFKSTDRGFLTLSEIERIKQKEINSERLNVIRDIFLFSCYTGLSYTDIRNLEWHQIQTGTDGKLWIHTARQKTAVPVFIPLLNIPLGLIEKYQNKKNTVAGNKIFKVPSNQKVNEYLKEIANICDINKRVTFHLARHTFATTITLNHGVPIETVSKLLGHTNIRTTQIYARITQHKIESDMSALALQIDRPAINL